MRILIVNPFGIGDVLFTTPLIANLKDAYPDSYIGYVCNARTKDILLNNPHVDKIFIYEKDQFRKLWKSSKILGFRKVVKFFNAVKKKKFDMVFDLSMGQEYGFFLWLAGIKKRVGYNYKNRGIFLTDKINISGYDMKHIADYYLDLLKLIKVEPRPKNLEFNLSEGDLRWASEYLADNDISEGHILIGLVPGGGASWGTGAYKKQWPAQRFAGLANRIAGRFNAKIMLLGDVSEDALCNQVASLIRGESVMACGKTTLARLAALMKRCSLVICNDGGPLHIAVSQSVKNISIFGPVDPKVYGPYNADNYSFVVTGGLACRPCYKKFKLKECAHMDCLNTIGIKEIMGAIENFLGEEIGGA